VILEVVQKATESMIEARSDTIAAFSSNIFDLAAWADIAM
jgi:hypothetical protein